MNELSHLRIRFFTQIFTGMSYENWECQNGEMVCTEKVCGIEIGRLEKGGQSGPKTFRLDSDLARHSFDSHLNTLTAIAKNPLEQGVRERLGLEQSHQSGPRGQ